MTQRLSIERYVAGVRAADRTVLGQAITLVESALDEDRRLAAAVLQQLAKPSGDGAVDAHRVGISGVPGVGKSTFIEALGGRLTNQGHRVAVLSVDPSSTRSGGSILGDKTRMQELARNPRAFVRPSPTSGSLGGVARATREAMLLCEAAGYDVMLVETVGVGQSEITVAQMVDFFLVLMLPGAGDDLQGIKRGILEVADLIAVNKADGQNTQPAELARSQYAGALKLMQPKTPHWRPLARTCSAVTGAGLDELWTLVQQHRAALEGAGAWAEQRAAQREGAMWRSFEARALQRLVQLASVRAATAAAGPAVRSGELPVDTAVEQLLAAAFDADSLDADSLDADSLDAD